MGICSVELHGNPRRYMFRGSPPLACMVTDFLLTREGLRRGAWDALALRRTLT